MYQLIIEKPVMSCIWFDGSKQPGDVVWVRTIEAARHLIEGGMARWPREMASQVQEDVGPSETKKFFGELMGGPSIGSPLLNPGGSAKLSSASAAALVSPHKI